MRIGVAGATNWGLTLAWLLARDDREILAFARTPGEAGDVDKQRGLARLPELHLPPAVHVITPEEVDTVDALVVAIPVRSLREFLPRMPFARNVPVLTGTKGFESQSHLRVSEVLADLGWTDVSVLSGPTLAREVLRGLPAAAVVASSQPGSATFWQEALASPLFRTYSSEDLVGVEVAGAYKNVVAIAAGASSGLGFGANSLAGIMTRGLAEMSRLGMAMGAQQTTFIGLAGVGDLAATCFSPLSRNHQLGERLARGDGPAEALRNVGEVVEGAATAPVMVELGTQLGVELPIAAQVSAVMAGEATVLDAMTALLSRSLKREGI